MIFFRVLQTFSFFVIMFEEALEWFKFEDESMTEPTPKQLECIERVENYYCTRLTVLVDQKQYDDSAALFEEFVVDGENPDGWFFMDEFTK